MKHYDRNMTIVMRGTPRENRKAERKRRSHEAILESAAALLRERGVQASSVTDVMSGAGLTVGGFYCHFSSKEHLFVEAIRSAASSMWSRLLGSATGGTPSARVMSVVSRYLSREHRDDACGGCLLASAVPEAVREGQPFRSAVATELAGFVKSFSELLEAGPARRERALGLVALMTGALSLSRALRGTRMSDEVLRAARKLAERALAADEADGRG